MLTLRNTEWDGFGPCSFLKSRPNLVVSCCRHVDNHHFKQSSTDQTQNKHNKMEKERKWIEQMEKENKIVGSDITDSFKFHA